MIQLAVFLGNPGKKHENTRHNVSRLLLPELPGAAALSWREKFHGRTAEYAPPSPSGSAPRARCILLQPETFMNLSGKSVVAAARFYKLEAREILVIHDDLELPFGTSQGRLGGGLGGHKGLRSTEAARTFLDMLQQQ